MLHGCRGVGKRCAAQWIIREQFGLQPATDLPVYPELPPQHPDLRWIAPPEDKFTIGIDAIRGLVTDLSLTSHAGAGKIAVIEPANAMTVNAANSLLKTLEEPPGDALLILIADRAGHLPATVLSRCQRIGIGIPPSAASLQWLDKLHPRENWLAALRAAGNAPLGAIAAAEELAQTQAMARQFAALPQGQESPLAVAGTWSKLEPQFVLDWMSTAVRNCIRQRVAGAGANDDISIPESVLRRMDRRKLFCYLDTIDRLRNQPAGSFSVQLTFEMLLIDWSQQLRHSGAAGRKLVRSPVFATG